MSDFNYFGRKNFMLTIAAILVIAMGYMALKTFRKPAPQPAITLEQQLQKLETQSNSDSIDSIEKDLQDTELNNLDKELEDIDSELNAPSY